MTLASTIKGLEKLAIDNSPALLTAVGVVGTIGTAVLTHRAALKGANIVFETIHHTDKFDQVPLKDLRKEKIKLIWKCYIPPVALGTITVVAIVGANHIGTKRAAAVAAAYSISEKAFTEYREKVVEKIGSSKEKDFRDEIAKDRIDRNPPVEREIIIASGDVLCYDAFTGRYFRSDMETIRRAENDTNAEILNDGYQSLSDFYERIGLPATSASEEVGWTTDKRLTVEFSTHMSADGKPCICIDFLVAPVRDYHRFR